MMKLVKTILKAALAIPLIFLCWLTLVRIVRHFYQFPMPSFMANFIDNPLHRKLTPPAEMPIRYGLEPGMRVLEVGPGNGRYTVAIAQYVGETGKVVAVDIQPQMLHRTAMRAAAEGVANIETHLADVHHLPFLDNSFDAVCMMTVIGEIPHPEHAIQEFHRVLRPGGLLSFCELWLDPDFPNSQKLRGWVAPTAFRERYQQGTWPVYTLSFAKA